MKHSISLFLFLLFVSYRSFAQCGFKALGPDDFKQVSFDYTPIGSIAMGPDNLPYAVFPDNAGYNTKLTLRRYNGTAWEDVGPRGFTTNGVETNIDMTITSNGTIYVAYTSSATSPYVTVMKYSGGSWTTLTNTSFANNYSSASIVVDDNGILYLAYLALDGTNTVKKFDGTIWTSITSSGLFKSTTTSKLLIDNSGKLCIVFQNSNSAGKITAMRFDGTQWNLIGSGPFSSGNVNAIHFTKDLSGTLYASYSDYTNNSMLVVKKFDGSSWSTLGTAGFPGQQVSAHGFLIDKNGTPFVAFHDVTNALGKISVMKFDGSNWIFFDTPGNTPYPGSDPILLSDSNGKIYLGCIDGQKLGVFKYNAGAWDRLGETCFTRGGFDGLSMATDNNKIPYVTFTDTDQKIAVMKYENQTWKAVGASFSGLQLSSFSSIAISSQNVPYVAYQEQPSKKIVVSKFDGSDWITVGTPEFSDGEVAYIYMAVDPFNVPYVAFADYSTSNKRITVMKYNGTAWVTVGLPRFSYSECTYPTLFFNTTGTPFVSFADSGNGTVWRCVSNTWSAINNMSGLKIDNYKSVAIDKNNNIYWAYIDPDQLIKLRKYNGTGTSWSSLPTSTFSTSNVSAYITMTIDDAGIPYVAYRGFKPYKANLIKYASNTWTAVSTDLSASTVNNLTVAMGANNTPIVAYYNFGLFAHGYACDVTTAIDEPSQNESLTIYPNPTNGVTTLDLKTSSSITMTNSMGQVILNESLLAGKQEIDLSPYPEGIYIVKITGNNTSKSIRLIKQN